MEALRVLLVDDHPLFRHGIKSLLDSYPEFSVVGCAGDGLEALAAAHDTLPDLILMDIEMPRCDGLEATRRIKRELPHVKIIMLTVVDDDNTVFEALKGGAEGYLLKDLEAGQFHALLDGLRHGAPPFSSSIAARVLQEFMHPAPVGAAAALPAAELSARERDVLGLLVRGQTNREIADALSITENTVKTHLANILAKLHLQNRIQAAVYAVQAGLAEPGG